MRKVLLLILVVTALPASAARLMILGDSLSDAYNLPRDSGWVSLLAERLGPEYSVINASISGETTAGGARRIHGLLESFEPEVLLVILGGNDGLRGLAPAQIDSYLEQIISASLESGTHVLLMQIRLPANLGPVYIERFEAVYPALADRHGIELVPFFLDGIFDEPGMLMPDRIHPTLDAQPAMLEAIWPAIEAALELDPARVR